VVLADPGGNEFCVIGHGSSFLAGTGFLGEVACDGGREVGLFWGAALGWPLVWDQDQETAIQSAAGGTKLAWGGPSPRTAPERQRFDLVLDDGDLAAEVARLVGLGASLVGQDRAGAILTDPGGFALRLQPAED